MEQASSYNIRVIFDSLSVNQYLKNAIALQTKCIYKFKMYIICCITGIK